MDTAALAAAGECAEGKWAWVLDQVRWDARGPWIPLSIPGSGDDAASPPADRDSLYDGIAGLAAALAELRLARAWTDPERALADGIVSRLSGPDAVAEPGLYTGLAGVLAAVALLDPTATTAVLGLLAERATPAGWPSSIFQARPAR